MEPISKEGPLFEFWVDVNQEEGTLPLKITAKVTVR